MRANEFMSDHANQADYNLDEDWKNWVAGAGLATMALGAGTGIYKHMKQDTPQPQKTTQQAPAPKKPEIAPQLIAQAQKIMSLPAAQLLKKVAMQNGIQGTELAQFLAQCAHETRNFDKVKEKGDKNYFAKYDIKYNPRLAKILGNTKPGDGERYKGRGFIQITGRDNYMRAGKALGLPLEQSPDLVDNPKIAAKVAVWYWQNRVAPKVNNFDDTKQVTRPINAALDGLQDRLNKFLGISYLMGDNQQKTS
jgi:putative chitinase